MSIIRYFTVHNIISRKQAKYKKLPRKENLKWNRRYFSKEIPCVLCTSTNTIERGRWPAESPWHWAKYYFFLLSAKIDRPEFAGAVCRHAAVICTISWKAWHSRKLSLQVCLLGRENYASCFPGYMRGNDSDIINGFVCVCKFIVLLNICLICFTFKISTN